MAARTAYEPVPGLVWARIEFPRSPTAQPGCVVNKAGEVREEVAR